MTTITVKQLSRAYTVPVEVLEHDCYEAMDYTVEEYTFYQPTPQQIDTNTDRDEIGHIAVCNVCHEDMPEVDLSDYYDDGEDY